MASSIPGQESQLISNNPMLAQLLSTLPKHYWKSTSGNLYQFQGFWNPAFIVAATAAVQAFFQAQPANIIIAGSPKTGNTWLKALCYTIANRTDHPTDQDNHPLTTNLPHALVPFLEFEFLQDPSSRKANHPLMSTHLPYTSLPVSVISNACKIIYICREPKDTFVSLWHFFKRTEDCYTDKEDLDLTLHEELDMFCQGKTVFGPYWDHVLGYYKASRDMPDNVLFLKYEELKEDTVGYVKKIAEFMGKPFTSEEETEGVPGKIVAICSFENLSGLEVNKSGKFSPVGDFQVDNDAFFRKGKSGDWENELTPDMAGKIDKVTMEKLKGSVFTFGQNKHT